MAANLFYNPTVVSSDKLRTRLQNQQFLQIAPLRWAQILSLFSLVPNDNYLSFALIHLELFGDMVLNIYVCHLCTCDKKP